MTIATFGIATPAAAVIAAAALSTGIVVTSAAATDSAMVIDVSLSYQKTPANYYKIGHSVIIDFADNSFSGYTHIGAGVGHSSGLSYSCGFVDNYSVPEDYEGSFVDINGGSSIGIDHCWSPGHKPGTATRAISVTFALNNGVSGGIGYDWYVKNYTISMRR